MLQPVIMAGGNGTRLWPLSRELYPKQFLNLDGQYSLLQQTVLRLNNLNCHAPLFICNEEHRFLVAEQLRQIESGNCSIILEPFGRNTAPALTLAALQVSLQGDDPILLVLAADHLIKDTTAFYHSIHIAKDLAEKNKLLTFGIRPTYPETGYGYIHRGEQLASHAYLVNQFIEKPDQETATKLINAQTYFWNSGIFMFRASVYLQEIEKFSPEIFNACKAAFEKRQQDMDFLRIDKAQFKTCPNNSIGYAVMEKTSHAAVVELDAGWSDIGSWSTVWDIGEKDEHGNVVQGDVLTHNSTNCLIKAENRLVATVGLDNIAIIETADAVLVVKKEQVQSVKHLVSYLKDKKRSEHVNHREVFRPWGQFDSIDNGHRYQVKRITVKPGKKLSVQMHHHRAEHWIVVRGTAKVTNGDKTYLVSENESTYIPIGQVHALENPGKIPLEIIEIQSGAYLGEDDIIRFEDRYGRETAQELVSIDYNAIFSKNDQIESV